MVVFEEKKFKDFGQFRLNLLIKISYIPDFEKKIQGIQKLGPKKDFFGYFFKKKLVVISLKLTKIMGSVKLTFILKLIFRFFYNNKIRPNQKVVKNQF